MNLKRSKTKKEKRIISINILGNKNKAVSKRSIKIKALEEGTQMQEI